MKISVLVQNLICGRCAKTITSKLSTIKAITDVQVDTESSLVSFHFKDINEAVLIKDKLKMIGYPSIDHENSVFSKAKSLISCVTGKISKS